MGLIANICVSAACWSLNQFMFENAYAEHGRKFCQNLNSMLHSITSVVLCTLAMGHPFLVDWIYIVSTGYFLQDLRNNKLLSIYTPHHIISIYALYALNSEDRWIILVGFFTCELANLPMYLVYGAHHHIRVSKNKRLIRILTIMEFIQYTIFRCLLPFYLFGFIISQKIKLISCVFHISSIAWTRGIWKQI